MLNDGSKYALCEVEGMPVRHPNRGKRKRFPVAAWRFREARLSSGLGVQRCADLLRVSDRTIRNWEAGAVRIPYAAYKLLRVLRGGRYLADSIWGDFRVFGPVLITPEGHRFHAGDLAWWSLLVRRAKAFGDLLAARDGRAGTGLPVRPDAATGAVALGLVSSSTTGTRQTPETGSTAENKGCAGQLVGADHRPVPGPLPVLRPVRDPAGDFRGQQQLAGGAA